MIFSIFYCIKPFNFVSFIAHLLPLLICVRLFEIITYKYLYTLTYLDPVYVLRHPNKHSTQTQLVVVVDMLTAQAKNILKM